jgi:MFS family permease
MFPSSPSIETRASWVIATVALVITAMAFGSAWIIAVALKDIAAEADGARSIPSLAASLAWLGSGVGGLMMGWIAERIGVRWTAMFGALMIGIGLALSTLGPSVPLYIGHGLFIGLLGISGINAPLYIYVSRWFDRRRGSALALISSGSYIAGALWPPAFERVISYVGWRQTMLWYAVLVILTIVPLAAIFLKRPPEAAPPPVVAGASTDKPRVFGWPPNVTFGLVLAASFLCCIPMAMPQNHLVAFCSDLGITASIGALMLSVLLGTAFLSRQIWGLLSDRIGGLRTALLGSTLQALAMLAFVFTQGELGLLTVSAAFGLGFSGVIPAYVLALREHFPPHEASWRIPALLLCTGTGMAAGGWLAGYLYDYFGYYAPAFAAGVAFNVINLAILATLVGRHKLTTAAGR